MTLKNSVKLGIVGILTAGATYLASAQGCDSETKDRCREKQLSELRNEFSRACEAKTDFTFYDSSLDKIVDERNRLGCAEERWLCSPVRRTYLPESSFTATFEYK
ncbi:MAG: hypothetical protein AABX05_04600 [Nanoarchaeota archaeon]